MKTHTGKSPKNRNRSVANEIAQKQREGSSPFPAADQRPEAIRQRQLQEMAGNSPHVKQLKALQERLGTQQEAAQRQKQVSPPTTQAPIQGYFKGADLKFKKGMLPKEARVSENLKIAVAGPQQVYAYNEKIKDANSILKSGSKIMLEKGEKVDLDMETAPDEKGMRTINFDDFYEVSPIYNPDVVSTETDTPRANSGEATDSDIERSGKHKSYVQQLLKLSMDFSQLIGLISSKTGKGVQSADPVEWHMALNEWLKGDPMRTAVLKAQFASVAGAYHLDKKLQKREEGLLKLFAAYQLFMKQEIENPQQVALPTDCGKVVRYIVANGETAKNDKLDDNPDIGSNYYTALPKNSSGQGWAYHWAGVVMKDGSDNVTLESAGGSAVGNIGKSSWWFQMYGTENVDQTFKKQLHETHLARNLQFVQGMEPGEEKTKILEELRSQKEAVDRW